ncbi:hypothetical protein K438DRAFT_1928614 [Mycena galopus ATCC 62051]|nr:hypothetical protein K438DRAFT_1928614 [Mycena galopus ATCC 62051]
MIGNKQATTHQWRGKLQTTSGHRRCWHRDPIDYPNIKALAVAGEACPRGDHRIMWAGGECVTRGYLNLPDKTNERYRPDPFTNDGAWRPDGALEHLGRIDNQVKIKGFRVELDGVAVAMETTDGVKAAAALLIDGELWGFVTPDTVSEDEVKMATAKIQPYYAVPTHIVALDSFPRTGNDKTDKRTLRQLALDSKNGVETISIGENQLVPLVTSRNANVPGQRTKASSTSSLTIAHTIAEVKTDMPMPPLPVFLVRQSSATNDALNIPVALGDSASSVELKEAVVREPWEGYEKDVLPDKLQRKKARNLRHLIFSLYRRLFSVVFVTNMTILVTLMFRGGADAQRVGLMSLANLFVAILMRQAYVVNVFFNVFCAVPSSSKRRIEYEIATVTTDACRQASFVQCRLIMLTSKRHDSFERVHRFCGWTAIILVWAQVVLTNDYRGDKSLSHALVHSPPFWMFLVMTGAIILPWLRLRKVPVTVVANNWDKYSNF